MKSVRSFQLLTTQYARRLLDGLSGSAPPALPAPPVSDWDGAPVVAEGLSRANRAGQSWVMPEYGERPTWLIFRERASPDKPAQRFFEPIRRIAADLDDETFVIECYLTFLLRKADDSGLTNYVTLLRQNDLVRRDVILSMLESEEGRRMASGLLVIPQPSPWAAALPADGQGQAAFVVEITGD